MSIAQQQGGHGAGRLFASPASKVLALQAGLDLAGVRGSGPQGRIIKADVLSAIAALPAAGSAPRAAPQGRTAPAVMVPRGAGRVFASPLSRAMAREAGITLGSLQGSGPEGRIVKADVLAALSAARSAGAAPRAAASSEPAAAGPYREIPHTFSRKLIARRLTESKQRAPHFYARIDCDIDALLRLRAAVQPRAEREGGRLSVNDFVLKAAALALRDVPAVNAAFTETAVRRYAEVHIAVAVALDDGLLTPVLKEADRKGVAQIAREVRDLAARARAGTLGAGASSGGTFCISNLGSYGVREFAAVINPPQAAILAVGAAEPRAVVRSSQLAIATMMTVTLSVDHRVVDGAVAAQWLAAFKNHVEHPREEDVWAVAPAPSSGVPP